MAGMCFALGSEPVEPVSKPGFRRRVEITKIISDFSDENRVIKRQKSVAVAKTEVVDEFPKFGLTSVCGRRRDMEDTVSIRPFLCEFDPSNTNKKRKFNQVAHFYGVFDGHGCSHVAKKCKERMHEIIKEEIAIREGAGADDEEDKEKWSETMASSFIRMDREVGERVNSRNGGEKETSSCRCELQRPYCDADPIDTSDAVGSTAVVAVVTADKVVVSNCGDSRAVISRGGVALPLSSDHKPDRPDELNRIKQAGGRVIYWDGPRVLGVLAMSRAIGDNYLKPYVIPDPEVTITDRTADDECLILASDGLWDVVSNETAVAVARMCLINADKSPRTDPLVDGVKERSDKACVDASILLTKLALARHSADNVSVVVIDLRR